MIGGLGGVRNKSRTPGVPFLTLLFEISLKKGTLLKKGSGRTGKIAKEMSKCAFLKLIFFSLVAFSKHVRLLINGIISVVFRSDIWPVMYSVVKVCFRNCESIGHLCLRIGH